MTARLILTLAAFYHVLATLAAAMAVFQFVRMRRGDEPRQTLWRHLFDRGEAHLWISGLILVAAGLYSTGFEYLDNPKLWTKLTLIAAWSLNSWMIKRTLPHASAPQRHLMFGISIGSLAYGSLLGVAKPLAYGVLDFAYFLTGLLACFALSVWMARACLRQN